MSQRLCITCNAPYGKRHIKGCPAYIEPIYTREMIEKFMISNGRKIADLKDGQKQPMMLSTDLDKLEAKFYQERN